MNKIAALRNQLLRVSELTAAGQAQSQITKREVARLVVLLENAWGHAKPMRPEHARILACLFQRGISSSPSVAPVTLLEEIHGSPKKALARLSQVCDLIEWGLLAINERTWDRRKRIQHTGERIAPSSLLDVEVTLSETLVDSLINGLPIRSHVSTRPYRSNAEYLGDWFRYVSALHEVRGTRYRAMVDKEATEECGTAISQLRARTAVTSRRFPFQIIAERIGLDHDEQTIVIQALIESSGGEPVSEEELLALIGRPKWDRLIGESPLSPNARLLSRGILIPTDTLDRRNGSPEFKLAPRMAKLILARHRDDHANSLERILGDQDVMTQVQPRHKLSDIVLPPETAAIIRRALSSAGTESRRALAEWGMLATTPGDKEVAGSNSEKLTILLHGDPGTGKTALAHAIAHTLKRPILSTEISRILDKWVGESEKRLSQLFDQYADAVAQLPHCPVLLLNEADQLLSVRGETSRAADRMYNQMQNILLERMERFSGILIATTNLIENIDSAFSRRFDLKIEVPRPALEERKRLWKTLIPKTLPISKDVCMDALATDYAITGGQISVVIKNAAIAAAARKAKDRVVTQADLIQYARLELQGSFESDPKNPIGFRASAE